MVSAHFSILLLDTVIEVGISILLLFTLCACCNCDKNIHKLKMVEGQALSVEPELVDYSSIIVYWATWELETITLLGHRDQGELGHWT